MAPLRALRLAASYPVAPFRPLILRKPRVTCPCMSGATAGLSRSDKLHRRRRGNERVDRRRHQRALTEIFDVVSSERGKPIYREVLPAGITDKDSDPRGAAPVEEVREPFGQPGLVGKVANRDEVGIGHLCGKGIGVLYGDSDIVGTGVEPRRDHGERIDVDGHHVEGTSPGRRDGDHARTCADINDAPALHHFGMIDDVTCEHASAGPAIGPVGPHPVLADEAGETAPGMLPIQACSGQPSHRLQIQAGLNEILDLGRRALVQIRSGSLTTGVRTSEPDKDTGSSTLPCRPRNRGRRAGDAHFAKSTAFLRTAGDIFS